LTGARRIFFNQIFREHEAGLRLTFPYGKSSRGLWGFPDSFAATRRAESAFDRGCRGVDPMSVASVPKRSILRVALVLAAITVAYAAIASPSRAQEPKALADDVAARLGKMEKTLSGKEFTFRARTIRAYAGSNGELLHVEHAQKTAVRRPDHLAVDVSGDDGSAKAVYDGKKLTVYAAERKQYAVVPVEGTIQAMLDVAMDRMGMDFPLADLLADNPQQSMVSDITAGGEVGAATIDGVPCKHFFFIQVPDHDMELWLEDNDKALPRRIIITYRALPGRPTFIADLSDWDFSVHPADAEFAFQPPAGTNQVELKPTANALPASRK
jgi:hypothetical protein